MPCYCLSQNTWVIKTPHFMHLLLTLFILLLPESLLVICFMNWHTKYLHFTTKSLIIWAWAYGFVFMSQNMSGIASSGSLRWFLSWSILKILNWLSYIHYNYNQYKVTESICYCVYLLLFYILIGDWYNRSADQPIFLSNFMLIVKFLKLRRSINAQTNIHYRQYL